MVESAEGKLAARALRRTKGGGGGGELELILGGNSAA